MNNNYLFKQMFPILKKYPVYSDSFTRMLKLEKLYQEEQAAAAAQAKKEAAQNAAIYPAVQSKQEFKRQQTENEYNHIIARISQENERYQETEAELTGNISNKERTRIKNRLLAIDERLFKLSQKRDKLYFELNN